MGRNLWDAVTIKDVVHIAKFVSKLMQFYVRDRSTEVGRMWRLKEKAMKKIPLRLNMTRVV